MVILYIILLSLLTGFLGRLGGRARDGHWYDAVSCTATRDFGVSFLTVVAMIFLYGFHLYFWYVYLIIFGLSYAAFTTYWDFLGDERGNFWVSGFVVGMALFGIVIINIHYLLAIFVRAIILSLIWGCLHKYLPKKVIKWDRAVAEEYLRYFTVIATLLIKF